MGTPEFAAVILAALIAAGHRIAAAHSQPPRPAGRGHRLQPSPVQELAEQHDIVVRCPTSLRTPGAPAEFAPIDADAAVVAAYGLILPAAILQAPRLGCLNVHASLLPRWRGAAPIQRAILAGDVESGVTIMKMDEGLDTGAMAMVDHVRIAPDMTAGELHDRLAPLGANLIVRTLAALERGSLVLMPQPEHGITYAAKISKDETRIDWSKPAPNVHNHIRGLSPFPGAWFEFGGVRVKALRSIRGDGSGAPGRVLDEQLTIACGEGAVRLLQVQRAGKHPMPAEEFLPGPPVKAGGTVA